jgi:Protein of unknown function (DUF3237)
VREPALRHVASLRASVEAPRNIARIASGGAVKGEIDGKILPGGADWAVNHGGGKDAVVELEWWRVV